MVIMVMCHWLACVWAMTLQLVDPGVPRWLDDIESEIVFGIKTEEPNQNSWSVHSLGEFLLFALRQAQFRFTCCIMFHGKLSEESPFSIYIASFYFCSYTMTSVGYGDLGPKNVLERVVCTMPPGHSPRARRRG